jgi:hypothetical protein
MRANTARRRVTLGLRSKITLLSRREEFVVLAPDFQHGRDSEREQVRSANVSIGEVTRASF